MISNELKTQIEAAFDFRGHVTVKLADGATAEGFLYNRVYANPKMKQDHFIDILVKGTGERRRFPMAELSSIELTGEDCAAGKSYEDYLKKKQAQQAAQ